MKLTKRALLLLYIALVSFVDIGAQYKVDGIVTDDKGIAVPGVSVIEKGTSNGTITDVNGRYHIEVSGVVDLIYSFIGFKRVEKKINGDATIDIKLIPDMIGLDEVVAIGYGSVKKSDLTGSVTSVKAEEIAKMPVQSFDRALQGRASGVQVKTSSAAPGGSVSVIIRGGNSINSSIQPLYVVDGIPVDEGTLNSFNPEDIESMEILKDASSTAIYGSRGANGVVLISTKRGKEGKARVEYSNYFKFEQIQSRLDLLNGEEFALKFNEWLVNTGSAAVYVGENRYFPSPETIGKGTDWIEQITQTGFAQNHQVSITGGTKDVKYALSGNYLDHEGVILGGDFSRGSFKVNTDVTINNWLSIGNNLTISRYTTNSSGENTNMESGGGTINAAIKMSPVLPVYDINGNYMANNFPGAQGIENPVANANEITNKLLTDRSIGSVFANLKPVKGLNIKLSYGVDIRHVKRYNYNPTTTISGSLVGGRASLDNNKIDHFVNDNIVNYKTKWGIHTMDLMAGYSREWEVGESSGMNGIGFPSDVLMYNNMSSAEEFGEPTSWKTAWQLESYFGRVNYTIDEKYLLTLTGRYDGSSKLSKDNRWAFFPSGAIAWRLSEENFVKENMPVISNLKLRTSYGLSGNSNIGLYKSQVILGIGGYPFNEAVQSAVYPSTLGNPDLGWEYTTTANLGVDVGVINNRLSLSVDVYKQHTQDLLWNKKLDPMSGYYASMTNAGELENRGLEISVFAAISEGAFKWNLSGNISFNRNKIIALDDEANQWKVGLPVGVFRGRQFEGIFRDWDEVYAYMNPDGSLVMPAAQPGDVRYADIGGALDENGNRMPDGKISGEDWTILGDPNPDFIFGITNDFSFKGFDLSVFITGSQGNNILNKTGGYLQQVSNMRNNLDRVVLNSWTPQNPDASFMRMGGIGSMPNIEDGSYIKLQNLNLSYNIPVKRIKSIQAARVFVSGQNLITLTNYSGFDPDVNTGGKSATNLGIDNSAYPMPRVYSMGVNVTF
ncbi:SusC/RagA family TonB-linked outer membrane protein [Carboxylicivirga taeanensis]|uniref:SusC/RagA family TonB-linked outer membrane protein n=1 Tax=Carboxylicivirga taeanensis TaxID=1416875 RepID=UPI003F6DB2DB